MAHSVLSSTALTPAAQVARCHLSAVGFSGPGLKSFKGWQERPFGPGEHAAERISLAVRQEFLADPTLGKLKPDTICNQEILNTVYETLNDIFHGNKLMFVPVHEIRETMAEIGRHVAEHLEARKHNPALTISDLQQKIGKGSHFAHQKKRHHSRHHAAHPAQFEHGTPTPVLFGLDRRLDGAVNLGESHQHSYGHTTASS